MEAVTPTSAIPDMRLGEEQLTEAHSRERRSTSRRSCGTMPAVLDCHSIIN